jgi:hypothetical protein
MKIKYYLTDNPITPDPNDRRAQVSDYSVVTEKELFEHMTRSGSAITLAEAKANYEEIIGTFDYFLKQGNGVNTEFINVRPVILGVFSDDDDKFDRGRHQIKYRARLGKRYNRTTDDIRVEKITPPISQPILTSFEDIASNTMNEMLTPGGVALLKGTRLKFKQNDPIQGIFLIDQGKNEYRVERILTHTLKQIVFRLPDALASDEYTLEIRILPPNNKEVRTGVLAERLIV